LLLGFTLSLYEYIETIPTLWDAVKGNLINCVALDNVSPKGQFLEFMKENPDLMPEDNALGFLSDDKGETYNKCHCKFPHYDISLILPFVSQLPMHSLE
jgi:alpha 1,2-mannosyltransferase